MGRLICVWPAQFLRIVAAIHAKQVATPSLRTVFGPLYRVLYVELRDACFQPLRDEFENYLQEHWWGLVCRRNRLLRSDTIAKHPRMTVRQVASEAGVAPSAVRHLVQARLIEADVAPLPSGRRTTSLHEASVAHVASLVREGLTLASLPTTFRSWRGSSALTWTMYLQKGKATKKPMTLGEQVRDAQKAVSSWSSQKKDSVRLEGSGIQQNRAKDRMSYTETLRPPRSRDTGRSWVARSSTATLLDNMSRSVATTEPPCKNPVSI